MKRSSYYNVNEDEITHLLFIYYSNLLNSTSLGF